MGKVKVIETINANQTEALYQFPMGKVKREQYHLLMYLLKYQFPMGKVKKTESGDLILFEIGYQFPMGKVKNNILRCVFIIIHRYRFVK